MNSVLNICNSRNAIFVTSLLFSMSAHAGGYDTGERDWNFLFQQKDLAVEAGVRFFNPQRRIKNVTNTAPLPPGLTATDETVPFSVERYSIAARFGESAQCLGSYRQPWGGDADYGTDWAGSFSAIEQKFSSVDLGLTCSISQSLDKGKIHLLGGISYQEVEYFLLQNGGPEGRHTTDVRGHEIAWRAGVAYEIPEYALLASLIYNSQVNYDMTGTVAFANVPTATSVAGELSLPQSLELKFQSGVAPKWLAFGAVKWTDWSVTDNMLLCPVGVPACVQPAAISGLTLLWEDSWTVTGGIAHQFSDKFSLAGSVTWDQGATKGFTSQTDTWLYGLTGIFSPSESVEIKIGGTIGIMTGGTISTANLATGGPSPVGYTATFDDDTIYTVNTSIVFRK